MRSPGSLVRDKLKKDIPRGKGLRWLCNLDVGEQDNRSEPNKKGWMGPWKEGKANVQILNIDDGVCQFTVYQLKKKIERERGKQKKCLPEPSHIFGMFQLSDKDS